MSDEAVAERPSVLGFRNLRNAIIAIFLAGVILRIVLSAISVVYDSDYWAMVIRNTEAGAGLYGAEGYYYTPVWGYVLSLVAVLQDVLLQIGEASVTVVEALFTQGAGDFYSATVPSLAFLYSLKIPLFICDTVSAWVVSRMVRERTRDDRKTALAFALAFLSPVLLMSSGVIAMPDTIAAMFAILTVYLLKKDMPLLAGMTFAMGVLTKFFPVFLIFVLVAYIFATNREDRAAAYKRLALAVVGAAATAVVVFLPQMMDGTLYLAFQFISDRTGSGVASSLLDTVVGDTRIIFYVAVLLISVYAAVHLYRSDGDPFDCLMKMCLLIATLVLVYPPTTQYIVIVVPFLAYWAAASDRRYVTCWWILGAGALVYTLASLPDMLLPLSVWGGLVDTGALMDAFAAWSDPVFLGFSWRNIVFAIGAALQTLGVLSVLWTMYGDALLERLRRRRSGREDAAT